MRLFLNIPGYSRMRCGSCCNKAAGLGWMLCGAVVQLDDWARKTKDTGDIRGNDFAMKLSVAVSINSVTPAIHHVKKLLQETSTLMRETP